MERPILTEINLDDAMTGILSGGGGLTATMSPDQWDGLLQAVYDVGGTLLVIDQNEKPTKAYRKTPPAG